MKNYKGKELKNYNGLPLSDSLIRQKIKEDPDGLKKRIHAAMIDSEYQTQNNLADALKTSREYLCLQINGKARPMSVNTLCGIADLLNVSVAYLIGLEKQTGDRRLYDRIDFLRDYLFSFGFEIDHGSITLRDRSMNKYVMTPADFDRVVKKIDAISETLLNSLISDYFVSSDTPSGLTKMKMWLRSLDQQQTEREKP